MIRDHARFAAYIAISYILFIFSGILLHFINTHDFYTLKFSLNLPSTWIAAFVSVVISWGLWHRKSWGWWLGLSAVSAHLITTVVWLTQNFSFNNFPSFGVLLAVIIQIVFLAILIFPSTRASCTN